MNTDRRGAPESQGRNVRELAPGIYQIRVPLANGPVRTLDRLNSYLIKGDSGWLMIDTGWSQPSSFQSLESSLHFLGLDFTDIRTVVLTHGHPDHYGMAGKIRQKSPGTELICHRWEADLIELRYLKYSEPREEIAFLLEKHGVPEAEIQPLEDASLPVLQMVTVALPDRMLYGGETISTGKYDLEVIWTPGHSPGHICLYEPQNRFLFCGDHVLPTITPNVGYHVFSGDNPLGEYFSSLGKLSALEVEWAHPGHEDSFSNLKERINSILEHHLRREEEILELINRGYSVSHEIASRLTWSLNLPWDQFPPIQKRLAINETIAHLEHLRWKGKIKKTFRQNRISYGPV